MVKYILSIIFISLFAIGTPVLANGEVDAMSIENPIQDISISVNGSKVRVTGANGYTLSVYNIAGVRVMSVKIDGADKQYELDLPKGCYILQVGKVTRKVSIN